MFLTDILYVAMAPIPTHDALQYQASLFMYYVENGLCNCYNKIQLYSVRWNTMVNKLAAKVMGVVSHL